MQNYLFHVYYFTLKIFNMDAIHLHKVHFFIYLFYFFILTPLHGLLNLPEIKFPFLSVYSFQYGKVLH